MAWTLLSRAAMCASAGHLFADLGDMPPSGVWAPGVDEGVLRSFKFPLFIMASISEEGPDGGGAVSRRLAKVSCTQQQRLLSP